MFIASAESPVARISVEICGGVILLRKREGVLCSMIRQVVPIPMEVHVCNRMFPCKKRKRTARSGGAFAFPAAVSDCDVVAERIEGDVQYGQGIAVTEVEDDIVTDLVRSVQHTGQRAEVFHPDGVDVVLEVEDRLV